MYTFSPLTSLALARETSQSGRPGVTDMKHNDDEDTDDDEDNDDNNNNDTGSGTTMEHAFSRAD